MGADPRRDCPKEGGAMERLLKPMLLILAFSLVGCVTKSRLRHEVGEGYARGLKDKSIQCLAQQKEIELFYQDELKAKTERLRKFNQTDEYGNLRPLVGKP